MLDQLAAALCDSPGIAHKRDIAGIVATPGIGAFTQLPAAFGGAQVRNGDDCAAIPDPSGEGWLLLAIEGFLNEFVEREPYFAGYCGVMVNISDIYAMGGRPLAVVDALWANGAASAQPLLQGMAEASTVYQVPIVGGHSNAHCDRGQLSVAVLGRARRLLTSFDAQPGDVLLAAIDLRGRYRPHFSNWDASSGSNPARLRGDLELLPQLAEEGLCRAAKDISQAGILGTALMLLECSGIGATIDIYAVPKPASVETKRWLLQTFPSYGFLLAVPPQNLGAVVGRFAARHLDCAAIGRCDKTRTLRLCAGPRERTVWDFQHSSLIGCGPSVLDLSQPSVQEVRARA